jgi:hypothetical protein
VVSGVPDAGAALALTPNQQVSIGLACNGVFATVENPLSTCVGSGGQMGTVTSKLLTLPQGGYGVFPSQGNDDHNPDRVKPRNILNLGIGTDNLLHSEAISLRISSIYVAGGIQNFASRADAQPWARRPAAKYTPENDPREILTQGLIFDRSPVVSRGQAIAGPSFC